MNLECVSWGGSNVNNANFVAYLFGQDGNQADGKAGFVERPHFAPVYTYKSRTAKNLVLEIEMRGTVTAQIDTLKGYFDTFDDSGLRRLIVKDISDSNRQWYVEATPIMQKTKDRIFTVTLFVPDPIWRTVTQATDTWSITATGQQRVLYASGNQMSFPIFRFQPTAAIGSGLDFEYRRYSHLYSQANDPQTDYSIDITNGGLQTSAMIADTTRSVQVGDAAGINSSQTTIAHNTPTGNLPDVGMAYVESEQITYTAKTAVSLTGVTRGVNGTTAATHAQATVIRASKVQADGDDLRVLVDGSEVYRWLQSMNSSSTKVWITTDLAPQKNLTLLGSVAATGSSKVFLRDTAISNAAFTDLPASGTILVEDEVLTYSGKEFANNERALLGVIRGTKGTTAGQHGNGTTIRHIEREIQIIYGSSSLASPVTQDAKRPAFDIGNSTNIQWDYNDFTNDTQTSAGRWIPATVLSRGGSSAFTTGSRSGASESAPVLGMAMRNYQIGDRWQSENAEVLWSLANPAKIWRVTSSGEKRTTGASSWPAKAALEYFVPGARAGWRPVWNEVKPVNANSWETWTRSACALQGSPTQIRFILSGGISASADNEANFDPSDVTVFLTQDGVPAFAPGNVGAACELTSFQLDAKLTNLTVASCSIQLRYPMDLSGTVEVDCDKKTITYLKDSTSQTGSLKLSNVRFDWFALSPGSNTIQFDSAGVPTVTLTSLWNARNS